MPPAWLPYVGAVTGIVGGLTGIAGSIFGYLGYRRSGELKKIDLRLTLRKELADLRDDVQELPKFIEYAKRSRTAAWAANGKIGTGAYDVWKETWKNDIATARALANEVPADQDYHRATHLDLESKHLAAHALKDRITRLQEKYRAEIAGDDVDREHNPPGPRSNARRERSLERVLLSPMSGRSADRPDPEILTNGQFLYRGVSPDAHRAGRGLAPKAVGEVFSQDARYGEATYGTWTYGDSEINAVLKHQLDQAGFPTSGVSTTPFYDRAVFYATHGGERETGYVYTIDRRLVVQHAVREFVVGEFTDAPSVPGDWEVILVAADQGILPAAILVDVVPVVRPDGRA